MAPVMTGTEPVASQRYSVLVLDYDPPGTLQQVVESIDNCIFTTMHDQEEAFLFFRKHAVDLVLLDHQPLQPCFHALKFFKATKPSVPVIILTAFGSEEFAVKVFRYGASDYIKKPILARDIRTSVTTALGIAGPAGKNAGHDYLRGLYRAIDYLHHNYTSTLRLENAARRAGMSISCFVRKFRQETGITFTLYVNRLRIARAIQLLRESSLSMSDIAFECGFSNQFHFTRTFKKIMGMTPSRYRKDMSVKNV